jgi:hypothetical protein
MIGGNSVLATIGTIFDHRLNLGQADRQRPQTASMHHPRQTFKSLGYLMDKAFNLALPTHFGLQTRTILSSRRDSRTTGNAANPLV